MGPPWMLVSEVYHRAQDRTLQHLSSLRLMPLALLMAMLPLRWKRAQEVLAVPPHGSRWQLRVRRREQSGRQVLRRKRSLSTSHLCLRVSAPLLRAAAAKAMQGSSREVRRHCHPGAGNTPRSHLCPLVVHGAQLPPTSVNRSLHSTGHFVARMWHLQLGALRHL